MIIIIVTGDDTPQLGDLCTNIVEHYVVHCYELGLKLGLKDYQLVNISEIDWKDCWSSIKTSRNLLQASITKWLEFDPSPTWHKLDDGIVSLTTNPMQSAGYKGTCIELLET